jgi:Na+/H+ antiporter NhaD/arsenite permease-like protein
MRAEFVQPNPVMIVPFALLLLAIALGPLVARHWWEKHYPKVSIALGLITLAYYCFGLSAYARVLHTAHEYISFIVLIGALFIVSGGIHITVRGEATPLANTVFLLIGAILANIFGTTGASMLLIRPWIRMNKYRVTAHHIVFFMFVVSNVGGCLTPVGDPPLFLGYLKGIPFWWVAEHCWHVWALGVGYLLAFFYVLDSLNYRRASKQVRERLAEPPDIWRVQGLWNLVPLAAILGAVFVKNPPFLREVLMGAAAAISWFATREEIHRGNHFNFHPLREVAVLFVGIFATMMPALDWLLLNAHRLSNPSPALFYWGSGGLSSFLDNAPTYLSFLSVAFGLFVDPKSTQAVQLAVQNHATHVLDNQAGMGQAIQNTVAAIQKYFPSDLAHRVISSEHVEVAYLIGNPSLNAYIVAISIGAVFFGANTYIGNGPNFMVKAIADHQKVHNPGFLGLISKYTLPVMLPLLILVWLLFFRS